MNVRALKVLEIAARSRIVFDGTVWLVPSQSSPATTYRVTFGERPSCTCEAGAIRKPQLGKHIIAARLASERDHGGKAPPMDMNEVPKKKTYAQNWPLYNLAQTTEKHHIQILLHDLCRGVKELPQPKTGRRPHTTRDRIFTMVYKVYSTFSARRFQCDLQDAHGKGYRENTIPGNKVANFMEDAALTPILKDLIVQSSRPLAAVETVFARVERAFPRRASSGGMTKNRRQTLRPHVGEGPYHHGRQDDHHHRRHDSRQGRWRLPAVQAASGDHGGKLHHQGTDG